MIKKSLVSFKQIVALSEIFYSANVAPAVYQEELTHQLRKMTLGISVGLVKDNPNEKYHFEPYAHFSPDHEVRRRNNQAVTTGEDIIHKYKVCEIRPPSLEKVLDQVDQCLLFVTIYVYHFSSWISTAFHWTWLLLL